MLLIYHPFRIGDQIRMGEHEGTIQTIRMRDTVVQAYDGRSIIIPNTKLITEVVINNTSAKLVRETLTLGIAPDADVKEARELILQVMEKVPAVTGRAERPVRIKNVDQASTQLEARFWFDPRQVNRIEIKNEIAEAVRQAFERAGIKWVALAESERLAKAEARQGEGVEEMKNEEVETV
jgi:small-conductance mechanosensitive channel